MQYGTKKRQSRTKPSAFSTESEELDDAMESRQ